ncbi:MAG: hypothetical protein JWP01_298 [Myxococcales bacterium]|nr:hypothetical protein [Myxococcales bacterium]
MRLAVLDDGHRLRHKALLRFIGVVSRKPPPDVIKTLLYRPEFFGEPMSRVFQDCLRGPSAWSVGDRELMAAFVSKVNECDF